MIHTTTNWVFTEHSPENTNSVSQIFARKIMRAFGSVSEEDLLNEARALDKLKASGRCENIVLVFKHGWLEGSSYYFIDMELCGCNLEHFTKGEVRSSYLDMKNPRFFGAMLS